MLPFVSVIIITKNNASTIRRCIESLLNQTYPKKLYEILFIDGNSIDGTDSIIKEYMRNYHNIRLFYENYGTMGYARNIGINNAKGEILLFTDGDAFCPSDWIKNIVAEFKSNSRTAIVGGLDILFSDEKSINNKVPFIINSWKRLKRVRGIKAASCIKTVNFAIKKNIALSYKGFDPKLSHLDETEFIARLIEKAKISEIIYDPKIIVYHVTKKIGIKSYCRKIFYKSMASVSILLRGNMLPLVLANPLSYIGTSFFIILICIISPAILAFAIMTNVLIACLKFSLILYLVFILIYASLATYKTRKFDPGILLTVTFDFIIRFIGTFLGLIKWFAHKIITILFKG